MEQTADDPGRDGSASAGVGAVLGVLEALSREQPAGLARLARETGVAKSTLHRTCAAMTARGWLRRDPASREFLLGPRALALGHPPIQVALADRFPATARRLVDRHNETTCLTVLSGTESVFVAKVETTHPVRLVTQVGSRLPAFASASGRVLLADLDPAVVDQLYADEDLVTPTGVRIGTVLDLHRILETCRARGYAENVDETSLGLHCIAVAVGEPSAVIAAITFCVPSGRMSEDRRRQMLGDLQSTARALAAAVEPRRRSVSAVGG